MARLLSRVKSAAWLLAWVLRLLLAVELRGQEHLSLSPELVLSGEQFGKVAALAVDRYGRLLVADARAYQIVLFDTAGQVLNVLGRRGEGPGEFQFWPHRLAYLPEGDVLYALELFSSRLHAWRLWPRVELLGTRSPIASLADAPQIEDIWAWGPDSLILRLEEHHRKGEGSDFEALYLYHWAARRQQQLLVLHPSEAIRTAVSYTVLPFLARTLVAVRPGREIAVLWTDSLTVKFYDIRGHARKHLTFTPLRRLPFTEAQWRQQLRQLRQLAPPQYKSLHYSRPQRDHWPYTEALLLDDQGQAWLRVQQGPEPIDRTEYLVVSEKGQQLVLLEGNVRLEVVQQGHAWGIHRASEGLQEVVRYRLPPALRRLQPPNRR